MITNKGKKAALRDKLLYKVNGGCEDGFETNPNPNGVRTFYHIFHDDILYGCYEYFYSEDEDPLVCELCGMPMHSIAE